MFRTTSAFLNTGIDELFKELGRKYIDQTKNGKPDKAKEIKTEQVVKPKKIKEDEDNRSSIRLSSNIKEETNKIEKKKCCS